MNNKILIKLYVPAIDEEYEIYIPTNESIKKVTDLITNSISEMSDKALPIDRMSFFLMDPCTMKIYDNSAIIRNTDMINNKKIVLV